MLLWYHVNVEIVPDDHCNSDISFAVHRNGMSGHHRNRREEPFWAVIISRFFRIAYCIPHQVFSFECKGGNDNNRKDLGYFATYKVVTLPAGSGLDSEWSIAFTRNF